MWRINLHPVKSYYSSKLTQNIIMQKPCCNTCGICENMYKKEYCMKKTANQILCVKTYLT